MQKNQRPHIIAEHQCYKKNDKKIQINSYSNNKYKYRYRKKEKHSNTILNHKKLSN